MPTSATTTARRLSKRYGAFGLNHEKTFWIAAWRFEGSPLVRVPYDLDALDDVRLQAYLEGDPATLIFNESVPVLATTAAHPITGAAVRNQCLLEAKFTALRAAMVCKLVGFEGTTRKLIGEQWDSKVVEAGVTI